MSSKSRNQAQAARMFLFFHRILDFLREPIDVFSGIADLALLVRSIARRLTDHVLFFPGPGTDGFAPVRHFFRRSREPGRLLSFPATPVAGVTIAEAREEKNPPAANAQSEDDLPKAARDRLRAGESQEDVFPRLCDSGMYLSFAALHKSLERVGLEIARLQELGLLRALTTQAYKWSLGELRQEIDREILGGLNEREKADLLAFEDIFGHVQTRVAQDDLLEVARRRQAVRKKTRVHVPGRPRSSKESGTVGFNA